jgi:hypothetical protein
MDHAIGWRYGQTRKSHFLFFLPAHTMVITSHNFSDKTVTISPCHFSFRIDDLAIQRGGIQNHAMASSRHRPPQTVSS